MNILVTGGTGFIGRPLCLRLLEQGHRLTLVSRSRRKVARLFHGVGVVEHLAELDEGARFDAVINLAGAPIADRRWSPARKRVLEQSRIDFTRELVACIGRMRQRPRVLLSASAVGYYGDQGDAVVTEATAPVDDYAHRLCASWEDEARKATVYGVRVCLLRTGLVLGPDGGFLKRLLPLYRLGLGGRMGDGQQVMSWIHRDDWIALALFLLQRRELDGPFNFTAPCPVTQAVFSRSLASQLHRPALLNLPAGLLRFMLGEMSQLLLGGQRVHPRRALEAGFRFRFEHLDEALRDVLKGRSDGSGDRR